jgi:PAS domain S-box-containing protein
MSEPNTFDNKPTLVAEPAPAPEPSQVQRTSAEAIMQQETSRLPGNLASMPAETMNAIVHELRAHQIELELQNEELRNTQIALENAKSRYFELYDLAPVGYLTLSKEGLITEANLCLSEILGVSRQDLLSQRVSRYVYTDDQDTYDLMRKSIHAATPPRSCELRMVRADGTLYWVKMVAAEMADDGGTVRLIVTDINERKKEQEVVSNKAYFIRAVADNVPGMLGYWDRNLRNGFANIGYLEWFGKTEEEMLGISMQALMGPELFAKNEPFIRAALAGEDQQFERELIKPNGVRYWVLAQYKVHRFQGIIQGFFALVTDITPLKQFEEKLQYLLTEKTGLLNEVHHRVKNNLQVITSLLRLEAGRSDQENTNAVLIEMQARIRAMALLHESLYRSGIFASIDLGAYLSQVVSQALRAQVGKAGAVRLQLELVVAQVNMDQAMPCGLLVNELISNCLKHAFPHERGGQLRVSLQAIDDANHLQLIVSDNGVGLPDDFETRCESSLGVQLARDLAMQIGGSLEVTPCDAEQKGQGTQCRVNFSIAHEKLTDPDRRQQSNYTLRTS